MKKTHLAIHQSSICCCPVVRSEGIPGMRSVVLRSAGSWELFSLAQQHNVVHPLNELTLRDGYVKPVETLRVCGIFLWLIRARWDQTVCTAPTTGWRKIRKLGNLTCCWILACFCFLCLWSFFTFWFLIKWQVMIANTHIRGSWPLFFYWRGLWVQMDTFKKLGNPQHSLSISTPAFHSLMKTTFSFHSRVWLKGMLDIPLDSNSRFHQTACWRPKVICVYWRIAVVMDSVDFKMTSRFTSSWTVKGPEAVEQNFWLCVTLWLYQGDFLI